MKATVFAPVNVALIKYWGKADAKLRLPANASLSVNLTNLGTTTTVEWVKNLSHDQADERMAKHLNLIRKLAKLDLKTRVITKNNFPASTGLSSSASGFAALTLATAVAAGLKLSQKDLSRLARLGSGSASRSIPDGWVEWVVGNDSTSYGKTIFPVNHWDLRILVVILSRKKKTVSSARGQELVHTSPFYQARLKGVPAKIQAIKQAIKQRNFKKTGEIIEADCLSMHQVMKTQRPALNYLLPKTELVMGAIRKWRREGLESYFTVNTGQNAFVFCQPKDEQRLMAKLKNFKGVIEVRRDRIGPGARIV